MTKQTNAAVKVEVEEVVEVPTQTPEPVKSILPLPENISGLSTTSAKIRALTALGWKRGDIAKTLNIRYQHVRNVQLQVLKRTDLK